MLEIAPVHELYDGKPFIIGSVESTLDNRQCRKSPIVETRAIIDAPIEYVWAMLCDTRNTEAISSGLAHYHEYPVLDPLKDEYKCVGAHLPIMPEALALALNIKSMSEIQTKADSRWMAYKTTVYHGGSYAFLTEWCETFLVKIDDHSTMYFMTDYMLGNPLIVQAALLASGGFAGWKRDVYDIVGKLSTLIEDKYLGAGA